MFVESHPRLVLAFPALRTVPLPHYLPNSFPLNPFADPHPLTPVASILYKNTGGGPQLIHPHSPFSAPLSPLAATLMDLPASVANKRLTVELNPLDATLTKNQGEGATRGGVSPKNLN